MDFTAFDFETANQYRTSGCALGIAVVRNDRVVDAKWWYIRPEPFEFSPFNVAVHGILPQDVENAPTFDALWPEIAHYFKDNIVVAHNAPFDVSILRHTLSHYGLPLPNLDILCSCRLAKSAFPQSENHKLNTICSRLNIPLKHHDCASDALGCAEIVCRLLRENRISTLEDLESHFAVKAGFLHSDGSYAPCRAAFSTCRTSAPRKAAASFECVSKSELFADRTFVFTGTLLRFTRAKAQEIVEKGGGIFRPSLTKQTNYLVLGSEFSGSTGKPSSKLKKAFEYRAMGCPLHIITEEEFISMIDAPLYDLCFGGNKK